MAKDPRETRIEDLPGPKSQGELEEMKMPYEEYCRKAFGPGNEWAKPDALKGIRWLSGTGLGFTNANNNERFLSMDYHIPEMVNIFYRLVKMSDGLTENYRPGTLDRWKMSYRFLQEMNPRVIYVWGGGFGYGPKIFGGSYDILGQAHAGLASITGPHEDFGGHATKCTNWCIDWYSGTQITCAIMAALNWRLKTGLGTMIEFSQVPAATRVCGYTAPPDG